MSSVARDNCGEGHDYYVQVPSKTIWKKFPILVFIDESRYPGTESKLEARLGIKRVIDQVNSIMGFSFYSIRLDKSISNLIIEFGELSSGIGKAEYSYRFGSPNETYKGRVILNTRTKWFINSSEQCHSSGFKFHMPATIAHEIGHTVGLDHNTLDNKATMRPFSQAGETLRETFGLSEKTFMHKFYDKFKPQSITCVVKSTTAGKRWECTNGKTTWLAGPDYRYNTKLASEA